ncbi:universal stress protein [Tunicatimonas pelagia]|uniref:universal stress protein n=1 Tax=Tunicatimonas pelagia TaxID=931531 RepID=UPI0026671D87|nr:universal stress protein [Tunicatimonas pelagia]WKN44834.1 universal stress protein [Tunicatimonas pelagia]
MNPILIPLDLTYLSQCALTFGTQLAEHLRVSVHLFSTVPSVPSGGPMVGPGEYVTNSKSSFYERQEVAEKTIEVTEHIATLRQWHPSLDMAPTVRVGDPVPTLLDEMQQHMPQLMVFGSDCYNTSDAQLDRLIRQTACPVLTVKCHLAPPEAYRDIVFLVDPERDHQRIIYHLATLQRWLDARLHLLRVNTPDNYTTTLPATDMLKKFVVQHQLENVSSLVVSAPTEYEGLMQYGESLEQAVIALGTHSRSFLQRLLRPNSEGELIAASAHPVWTFGG